jgi:hypothetical protein
MNTQEHLQKIKAKCQELLAIAEKRTQGQWSQDHLYVDTDDNNNLIKAAGNINNAAFIASCAGAAEAGWRATIAFIDAILPFVREGVVKPELPNSILAAWPQELL